MTGRITDDLRQAARLLALRPGFTAVAVTTLALGIGATTAIFSVVNGVILQALPYEDAGRLVYPFVLDPEERGESGGVSYLDYRDWNELDPLFEAVAVFDEEVFDLVGDGDAVRVSGAEVSPEYFRVLRAQPVLGRTFRTDEFQRGNDAVVVISEGLWGRRFGSSPEVLGREMRIAERPHTVVGVLRSDSVWPRDQELWLPLVFGDPPPRWMMQRQTLFLRAIGRLQPGVEIDRAAAELAAITRRLAREDPAALGGHDARVLPLKEVVVGPQVRLALWVLLGAAGFVLLSACVNVANLLLARASERRRDIAIRMAMGANRSQVLGQLLAEGAMLALAGGAVATLASYWGVRLILSFAPGTVPRVGEVSVDASVLLFALGLSLLTACVFGVAPALHAWRTDLTETLKDATGSAADTSMVRRVRGALVVSEIALSLVLLVAAGLMIRSFARLALADPGTRTENLLTLRVELPESRYDDKVQVSAFFSEFLERVERLPGVRSATVASAAPLGAGGIYMDDYFLKEGDPEPPAGREVRAGWNYVFPGYFRTLGIPLLQGRAFDERDDDRAAPVVIVNRAMARQAFGAEDAVGRRIVAWQEEDTLREIVGVVGNVRQRGIGEPFEPLVYAPHGQIQWDPLRVVVVHTSVDPLTLADAIRSQSAGIDPDLILDEIRTMEQVLDAALSGQRFNLVLLSVFAAIALALAAIGIYGVMSYVVSQRTREIGIRMALGAGSDRVLRDVVAQGLALAIGGLALGGLLSFAGGRVIASMLYETSAADPLTYAGVCLLLLAVAVAASFLPARRAARVDPLLALRNQ